mmetsp:Transcript_21789/g.50092  ORF Transcript_21789/g.50092 Transcript_21789/m.50092 type:complete len:300 (-) Transcript_21789:117-1016(-)
MRRQREEQERAATEGPRGRHVAKLEEDPERRHERLQKQDQRQLRADKVAWRDREADVKGADADGVDRDHGDEGGAQVVGQPGLGADEHKQHRGAAERVAQPGGQVDRCLGPPMEGVPHEGDVRGEHHARRNGDEVASDAARIRSFAGRSAHQRWDEDDERRDRPKEQRHQRARGQHLSKAHAAEQPRPQRIERDEEHCPGGARLEERDVEADLAEHLQQRSEQHVSRRSKRAFQSRAEPAKQTHARADADGAGGEILPEDDLPDARAEHLCPSNEHRIRSDDEHGQQRNREALAALSGH